MKNKLYFIITATVLGMTHNCAHAVGVTETCSQSASCFSNCTILTGSSNNCRDYTTSYYYDGGLSTEEYGGVISCNSCNTGTRTKKTFQVRSNCTATYYTCECPSSCKTTDWAAGNTGYQTRTVCNTSTCTTTTEYRCAVGYYGSSTNGTSGCTKCPTSGGISGTTAAAGSTSITSCYLPSGSNFSETSGSGTYTGNCYYKN